MINDEDTVMSEEYKLSVPQKFDRRTLEKLRVATAKVRAADEMISQQMGTVPSGIRPVSVRYDTMERVLDVLESAMRDR